MVDISIVTGIINQLITWGAPPCIVKPSEFPTSQFCRSPEEPTSASHAPRPGVTVAWPWPWRGDDDWRWRELGEPLCFFCRWKKRGVDFISHMLHVWWRTLRMSRAKHGKMAVEPGTVFVFSDLNIKHEAGYVSDKHRQQHWSRHDQIGFKVQNHIKPSIININKAYMSVQNAGFIYQQWG